MWLEKIDARVSPNARSNFVSVNQAKTVVVIFFTLLGKSYERAREYPRHKNRGVFFYAQPKYARVSST